MPRRNEKWEIRSHFGYFFGDDTLGETFEDGSFAYTRGTYELYRISAEVL
jgi:hypothetical protein